MKLERLNLAAMSAVLLAMSLGGCRKPADPVNTVVVYVAHDLLYSRPLLMEFQKRTGITVKIVGDTEANKTTGLALRLMKLAGHPEADVFWNNEVMQTVRLADRGILEPYVPSTSVGIPTEYCDAAGRWVGFAARARIILYNKEMATREQAPRSIFDLTDERYRGKVAIANPLFGTTATHVAALFAHLGSDKTKTYLTALKDNGVLVTDGNAMARNLVRDGRVPFCLTDTDDANGALVQGKPVAVIFPDQADGDIGTLVIPNSVALVKGGPHPEAGKKLVDYLASTEVEEALARSKAAQMPLRKHVKPHSDLFDFSRIRAMRVDWNRVASKTEECSQFVRKVFLE